MIGNLALKTAEHFVKNNNTLYKDVHIYQYGFFILYSNLIYLVLTAILGIILNAFLQSIIFFVSFFLIRQFAGGYHAKNELRCEIVTTLSILACIVIIRITKSLSFDIKIILLIISMVSVACISFLCPLDSSKKPLTDKEIKYFRKISFIILFVITTSIIASYFCNFTTIFIPCCLSLTLEAILILISKINKIRQKHQIKEA